METIQVVIDAKLLKATEQAAQQSKVNRSALIRDALRAHLKQLKIDELEERERQGYAAQSSLGKRVAQLSPARIEQLCFALRYAMGC